MVSALLLISVLVNVALAVVLLYVRLTKSWLTVMEEGETPDPHAVRRPEFRRFVFNREVDVTGISGTGIRVEGVVFSDGWVVNHWLDMPPMNEPKTEVWHNPGVDPLIKISGHNGSSKVVWLDGA